MSTKLSLDQTYDIDGLKVTGEEIKLKLQWFEKAAEFVESKRGDKE